MNLSLPVTFTYNRIKHDVTREILVKNHSKIFDSGSGFESEAIKGNMKIANFWKLFFGTKEDELCFNSV